MARTASASRHAEQPPTPADAREKPTSADTNGKLAKVARTAEWPADAIERRPLDSLVPYAKNARLHSDAQVAQIAGSMREWGWTAPILVSDDGMIIAGHGRVLAARSLRLADAPVMIARGWSREKIAAYVIADNRLAENAAWDRDMLGAELASLQGFFDLSLTGFSKGEIEALCVIDLPELGVEYDENAANGVKYVTCPKCGHEFPR
ncbi:ParB/Srx family N-terminal domain-containing protein [Paraburkholderia dipogonis]|uniref:ParB/Srx family N-terminal domain-containing protein n=1 Tax=Paraburkholderia dipogonis TaxID=1211383 RepID=UPI0038B87F35